jgi:hypothetical protein
MIPRQVLFGFFKPLILQAWALTNSSVTPTVALARPNVGEPPAPAFIINFSTARNPDNSNISTVDEDGDVTVSDQAETTVTITGIGIGAMDALEDLATGMRRPTTTWAAQRLNVAVIDRPHIVDVSKLVNPVNYEERGTLSVNMRFVNSVVDNVGIIETVNLEGEYTGASKEDFTQDFSLDVKYVPTP